MKIGKDVFVVAESVLAGTKGSCSHVIHRCRVISFDDETACVTFPEGSRPLFVPRSACFDDEAGAKARHAELAVYA